MTYEDVIKKGKMHWYRDGNSSQSFFWIQAETMKYVGRFNFHNMQQFEEEEWTSYTITEVGTAEIAINNSIVGKIGPA